VWVDSVGERESRLQVLAQHASLFVRFDGGQQLVVHVDLSGLALLVHRVGLFFGLEDLGTGLRGLGGLGRLDTIEELVVQVGWHVHFRGVDLLRRGDHVDLVDASQRATVQLEWATHEQQARLELLQENDTFSSMTASDQDQHGSRSD